MRRKDTEGSEREENRQPRRKIWRGKAERKTEWTRTDEALQQNMRGETENGGHKRIKISRGDTRG